MELDWNWNGIDWANNWIAYPIDCVSGFLNAFFKSDGRAVGHVVNSSCDFHFFFDKFHSCVEEN